MSASPGRPRPGRCGPGVYAAVLLSFVASLAPPRAAQAQFITFGKNKVQYTDFRWKVLESRHIHLYYYENEYDLAVQALGLAEAGYDVLRARFVLEVAKPIPLILYSSHQDFEQTNVTPGFLPEGVAGLTEFAKGRVLIPFDGSLSSFRATIQHELVHVFQFSAEGRVYREHFRPSPLSPPLWFSEGLAVHWSEDRNTEADMVLRNMILAGSLPSIDEFWRYEGGYTLYKLGQSVLDYIGEEYGDDRIRFFYERLWANDSFDGVIRDVLGIESKELNERWTFALKKRYFPQVEQAQPASFISQPLTMNGGADFKPLPLPRGLPDFPHHFAFLSPRNGFTNLYTASMEPGRREHEVHALVEGERRPEFESFHAFRSRMDVSDDGTLLFVSKHQDRDEIVLFSLARRKEVERHAFPHLAGLSSPGWAPGPDRFVFSGLSQDGFSDLYLYDRPSGHLTRLTSDRFSDLDPAYCPWLDAVVFSSDRAPRGDLEVHNLFLLDLSTGAIRYLTRGNWSDLSPACDRERREIYFVSDRSGLFDVYRVEQDGRAVRLTHSLNALSDPRPVPGEPRFLATVFREKGFQIHSFPIHPDTLEPKIELGAADTTFAWDWRTTVPRVPYRNSSYRPRFSLDVAQGGVLYDPGIQTGEGMQAAFSDVMGNHLVFVGLGNTTFTTSDLLRNLSGAVTYVNLSRRLNYGLTIFHFTGDFLDATGFPFFESRSGAGLLLRYPLSKYERIESELSAAYQETDRSSVNFHRVGPVSAHTISYIRDTSLWLTTGPIDGVRMNLTAGAGVNLRSGASENTTILGDYRRYLRLGLYSGYALRMQGRWSQGPNPEIFLLGGSNSLRLWPERSLSGERALLLNHELRFPLVRGLTLGLPMGNLELPGVQGAVFGDAGAIWDQGWPPPWLGSTGFGLRMGFGGFLVLRVDVGRRTDFHSFDRHTRSEFYLGWNY
jgi:hypothetical protein